MLLVTVFTTQSLSIKYGRQASNVNDKCDNNRSQGSNIVSRIRQRLQENSCEYISETVHGLTAKISLNWLVYLDYYI